MVIFHFDTIDYLLSTFSTILLFYVILINISMQKLVIREFIIEIGTIMLVVAVISVMLKSEFISTLFIVVLISIFFYLKNKNLLLSIIYPVISVVLVITISNGISILFYNFIEVSPYDLRQDLVIYCLIYGLTLIITFAISKRMGLIFTRVFLSSELELNRKMTLSLVSFLITTLVIYCFNAFLITDKLPKSLLLIINSILLYLDFIFIVFQMYSFLRLIKQSNEIKNNQELVHSLKEYARSLENMHSYIQSYRHDVTSTIFTLYGLINDKKYEELEKFFLDRINPFNQKDYAYNALFSQLEKISMPELKAILASKLLYAVSVGIIADVEINENIDTLNIDIIDLVKIVGILMDNAIEESQKIEDGFLKFIAVKKASCTQLFFVNQIEHLIHDISRIYDKDYTSKGYGHGIGLYNFKSIMSKYNKISFKTSIEDNKFIQEITFIS